MIEQLGWDAKAHPDQLIFGMMKAAVTGSPVTIGKITIPVPTCYDGNNLYYASHLAGPAGETSASFSTTYSNLNSTGSGNYWFLSCDAGPADQALHLPEAARICGHPDEHRDR